MSSPTKVSIRTSAKIQTPEDDELPLHIALVWMLIKLFPTDDDHLFAPVYSTNFTGTILDIIARELLEASGSLRLPAID